MKHEVDHNIPIPDRKACVVSPIRLALDEMRIGDSFWMPTTKRSTAQNAYKIAGGDLLTEMYLSRLVVAAEKL